MKTSRHDGTPGLREVWLVWGLFGLVAAAIFATYARLPVAELYHVSGNGRGAATGRVLVFLNWPTALAAIAVVALIATGTQSTTIRRLCVLSALLCTAVAWPGMVDQVDLDAKPANLLPAAGVLLALALTISETRRAGLGPRAKVAGDRIRLVTAVVLVLLALEWIVADLGFLIGRLPVLGSIFYSDEWWAPFGHARLEPAVHHGHHHGMDGTLLALTAIILSRTLGRLARRARLAMGAYLAIMLAYGLAVAANDFWLEQVVKRDIGVTWQIPSVIVPRANVAWLVTVALAAVFFLLLLRQSRSERAIAPGRLRWPAAVGISMTALLVVGLLHASKQHRTPTASIDGITLAAAPNGTSHLYITRNGELARLTEREEPELAPNWSPAGRLVFQSKLDGRWELFGRNFRPLTAGGEPRWDHDGKRIAFVRDDDLYVLRTNGRETKVADDAAWPAWGKRTLLYDGDSATSRYRSWSAQAEALAYECLRDDHWHICVGDSAITHGDANDFAPAWSPDGKRIAFISDRDGNDQLYVMRADGSEVRRLTSGQAEKDTPSWRP